MSPLDSPDLSESSSLGALFPVSHTRPLNPLNLPWLLSLGSLGLLGTLRMERVLLPGVGVTCLPGVCPAGPRVSAAELVEGCMAPVSIRRQLHQLLGGRDVRFVLQELSH